MRFCPACGKTYPREAKTCLDCAVALTTAPVQDDKQGELFETYEVCKVPDEITGLAVRSFLLDAGLDAVLQDMRASFYGNVISSLQGFWGRILVPIAQQETAQKKYTQFCKEFEGR